MRDAALERAIGAAGGVRALARAMGVSQPAISSWTRVPADRVLSVETSTGVPRTQLRPDLYPDDQPGLAAVESTSGAIDEIDEARAQEYELVGALLWRAPTQAVLDMLAGLRGDASQLGMAHLALAEAARDTTPEEVGNAFFEIFIGVGRGEILPYASYYLTGFLHERPLALVREDMGRLGLAREARIGEPEDHMAILMDVMANLIRGTVSSPDVSEQDFLERHILPWGERFFADLEVAKRSAFYRAVGRIGSLFLSIEAEAARLPA